MVPVLLRGKKRQRINKYKYIYIYIYRNQVKTNVLTVENLDTTIKTTNKILVS